MTAAPGPQDISRPNSFAATAQAANHLPVDGLTPAGIQQASELSRRRWLVLALNLGTWALLLWALSRVLSAGGWTVTDWAVLICFALGSPWTVLGFWNAVIGFWLLHGARSSTPHGDEYAMARVAPFAKAGDEATPLTIRTAVLMTLRNEDPARAFARLRVVKASLDATGEGHAFDYFVLSDTNDEAVGAAEEQLHAAFGAEIGDASRLIYRRRTDNAGFKAGNVRDFLDRWGDRYELMLPLDADSLMSGVSIVRLARMMQAWPRLGILQSLVVGMPSQSAFARIFQFGMRAGMRSYTMGQAWWVGDCGPFWGHNAIVRIAPFRDECHLPVLPGPPPLGGAVMSHDQVEATLMRRAGYEVRVLPIEDGSWEENPPTMLEFARRDLRWCLGNLQYLKLLDIPGLKLISRFQLVWAILMFIGLPAWTLMIALLPVKAWEDRLIADYPTGLAIGLYLVFLTMYLSPKLAGMADILLSREHSARYGGRLIFAAGALVEIVFSFLQGAVSSFRTTLFMIGLPFGKASIGWNGQARDAHALSLGTAFTGLWPHLLFGVVICGALWAISPRVLLWSLPLTAGYLLAIPFAVVTSWPSLGKGLQRIGLCAIPEDVAEPADIAALHKAGA
jgi:membrane glycosyltransferase